MAVTISSRTPEGHDSRCPLCGAEAAIEYSLAGDAACPNCGTLLWGEEAVHARIQRVIAELLGIESEEVTSDFTFFGSLGTDSLDVVEIFMVLEEEFDIQIPEGEAEKIRTVGDAVRFILRQRQEREQDDAKG